MEKEKILAYALKNAIEHNQARENFVLNSLFHEGLDKKDIPKIILEIKKTIKKVNSLSLEQRKAYFERIKNKISERKQREGLPDLKITNKPVFRLAPFPSGSLHIGNARGMILNDEYTKLYSGKLLLMIDDTIGSEKKAIVKEAYSLIPEGLEFLDIEYNNLYYKSDRLETYYKYAEKLIKKAKAYVCFCSQEKLRENRKNKKECEERKQSVKETLDLWKKMLKGDYKEGEAVLRIKTNMKHKNPAFRDRVIFRISKRKHPRIGNKYQVWPLLDFSWAIDDKLLKITHIIRGKELMIETDMEKYIFDIFKWKHPEFIHIGLLNFKGIKLSKSKGQQEVKSGKYIGWDDPRTWSLQSLEKRGIQKQAIREFLLDFGLTQKETTVPIEILYEKNRKILYELSEKAKIVKYGREVKIRTQESKVKKIKTDLKKDKEYVHFIGLGYCKFNKKSKEYWLSHK